MNRHFIFFSLIALLCQSMTCNKSNSTDATIDPICYKGKLIMRGLCGNAVVQVMDPSMPPAFYEASWRDPMTGTVYENVMGNLNYCSFPGDIKENTIFNFTIEYPTVVPDCAQCKAYSPSPEKRHYIRVCSIE